MKNFIEKHFKVAAALVAVIIITLIGTVGAFASGALPISQTVGGTATITIQTPPNYSMALWSNSNATDSLTSINFSGSVVSGSTYTKTKTIYISNNGTNGTNGGASATINGLTVSSPDLPEGWTLTTNYTWTSLAAGSLNSFEVTLSSGTNTFTAETQVPTFSIVVTAN